MEYLIQFFTNITNDPAWAYRLFSITVGVSISLLVLGFAVLLVGTFDPLHRRLKSALGYSTVKTKGFSDSQNPLAP
jgi:hypothetical protein